MKTTAMLLATAASAAAFTSAPSAKSTVSLHESKADLESLAGDLNPFVKFYDPLKLADADFWSQGNEATIGFLRHSEIKHGRVAMFAFVGYCVQSNFHWPWPMRLDGTPFPSTDLSPPEQWASLPIESKHQILTLIGFLEIYSELASSVKDPEIFQKHYMRGGQPGKFPKFGMAGGIPHPVPLNYFDPFGLSKNASAEKKAKGLKAEINNGRLAMLGLFGFITEQTIPGSVPALSGIVKPYSGDLIAGDTFTFL